MVESIDSPLGYTAPLNWLIEREEVEKEFFAYHTAAGYRLTAEVPPYPSPDRTVLFIGAQISVWKPALQDVASSDSPGLITPQNCIRLQNREAFYTDEPIRFSSYFRTLGALGRAALFADMVNQAEDYLGKLGITNERLCIKTSSEQAAIFNSKSQLLIDTEEPGYYAWTYGEPTLNGEGVTLAVRNEQTGHPYDIGNVILIRDGDKPLVAEWGFGIETLLAASHSVNHPILFADLPAELLKGAEPQDYKYLDALMTSSRIADLGLHGGERGVGALFEDYLRGAAYQAQYCGRSVRQLISEAEAIAKHIGLSAEAAANLQNRLQYYTGRINFLRTKKGINLLPTELEGLLRLTHLSKELAVAILKGHHAD